MDGIHGFISISLSLSLFSFSCLGARQFCRVRLAMFQEVVGLGDGQCVERKSEM